MACDFLLLIVFVWSILCVPTLGWGDVGHRTVAYLAEQYLNEQAKGLLNDLLPRTQDFDISDAAIWADELRHSERPSTAVWHYVGMLHFSLDELVMKIDVPSEYRCER
jgi:hypothetical protein